MKAPEKHIELKDGSPCLLRSPEPADAEVVLRHLRRTAGETVFLARYPEEVNMSLREERTFLRQQLEDPRRVLLAAFVEEKLAACAGLNPAVNFNLKYRHRAQLGISVRRHYWGLGLGRLLVEELCSLAGQMEYTQVELEVACANQRAVTLYRNCGFTVYGQRPDAVCYKDGTTDGEYLMVRNV